MFPQLAPISSRHFQLQGRSRMDSVVWSSYRKSQLSGELSGCLECSTGLAGKNTTGAHEYQLSRGGCGREAARVARWMWQKSRKSGEGIVWLIWSTHMFSIWQTFTVYRFLFLRRDGSTVFIYVRHHVCVAFSPPTTRVAGNLQTFMGKIGVEVGGGKRKSAIAQNIPKKVKAVT